MKPTDFQPDQPEHDRCDELLAPLPTPSEPTGLREQLLRRTTRILRWRRRMRLVAVAAALAACWAGGMFTMRWLSPSAAPGPLPVLTQSSSVDSPRPTPQPSALVLEWQAVESDNEQAKFARIAGDAYLNQEHDPLSAVRCYGRSLDVAPEQAAIISTDDEWLLMAIKDARNKEKRNAKAVD